jgi:hypothetical protein
MYYLHCRLMARDDWFQWDVLLFWMIRRPVAASPVVQLKDTEDDRDCNTGEVSNDVQDVQSGSKSTVAFVAVVGRAAGHDGECR